MSQVAELNTLAVGDEIPEHDAGPITRWVLAMFAGGSGDPNPMHIDSDFARMVGREDVFAHGMLSMAYLAQLLTNWVPQDRIRSFSVRFASITPVNTSVRCKGKIIEKFEEDGEQRLRLELVATVDDGAVTLTGEAVVACA
ncbi:MaoC/PaaZ C-terminal domain-containing protein [Novosphingobium aquae]|jgi:acyl dehydratase|uniref:MaoC/PaaZ C-terminal domain-containing protein n=1 Tax=Novosphingobium aquae TaxID=3133435 RepID=A0ABU8SA91_9SPHN